MLRKKIEVVDFLFFIKIEDLLRGVLIHSLLIFHAFLKFLLNIKKELNFYFLGVSKY
jgi:hypothetical protein